jgi:hypothetical protein
MNPGDLVVIQNEDVIESFMLRESPSDGILYGILIELHEIDQDRPQDDVWIVLIDNQLYKMLRWEFEPCNKMGRVVL